MRRQEFESFLENLGYADATIGVYISSAERCEKIIVYNLDSVVQEDVEFIQGAMTYISKKENPGRSELINSFRLYYHFATGRWIDNWRPRASSDRKKNKRTPYPKTGVGPTSVPASIPDYSEEENERMSFPFVLYEKGIPEDEKIPGLRSFIESRMEGIFWDVKRLFRESFNERYSRYIPIILSNKYPTKTYEEDDEALAQRIIQRVQSGDESHLTEDIVRIMNSRSFSCRVTGEYFSKGFSMEKVEDQDPSEMCYADCYEGRQYVVIYYRNFCINNVEEYCDAIRQTLAHEYAHYFHHLAAPETFSGRNKIATAVKEAVADYCSVLELLEIGTIFFDPNRKNKCAIERFNSWKERFGSAWPYANALYLCMIRGKVTDIADQEHFFDDAHKEKLETVIHESAYDMSTAYEIMKTF